jgi:hypothetical protein
MSLTAKQIEAIKTEYEPRVLGVLNEWRGAFTKAGYRVSEVSDMSDECYRWDFVVYLGEDDGYENSTNVSFTIAESGPYAGDTDENDNSEGINVLVDVVHYDGHILGGFSPYNYSSRVWTDDPEEWRERFVAFENIDPDDIIESVSRR